MIGDYVNFLINIEGGDTDYDPKVAQYQPMQIVSLSSWANNDGEVESAEGVINDIDQVKPIPLTPEILEKNGFVKQAYDGWLINEDNSRRLIEYRTDYFDGFLIINYTKKPFSKISIKLKHVHELQHALRLCGINKEIVL